MNETVTGGTDEVGTFRGDTVPGPLEHLNNYRFIPRRGTSPDVIGGVERSGDNIPEPERR